MKYELLWKDKDKMLEDLKELKNEDIKRYKIVENNSKNIIIKDDNLNALHYLQQDYAGKIKVIYIDPPYNTGKNFIYKDNYKIKGDKEKHSKWLNFMYPRLYLARDLLKEDGVIFISIDDNEQANLKILCDEIFGEENFISCFVWQKKSGGGQAQYFYEGHEYLLIYAKDKNSFSGLYKVGKNIEIENDIIRKVHGKYSNNVALKELYKKYPNQLIEHRNLMFEELEVFLQENMIGQKKYQEIKNKLDRGEYFLQPYSGNTNFHLICRYNQDNLSLMYSVLNGVYNSDGANEFEALFDGNLIFNNPKPCKLLKQLLEKNTRDSELILDFFAGSGTTAQAVMELNAQDGGNRKFILVQLPEIINEDKNKLAYDFVKNELDRNEPKISDITQERVRRVSKMIQEKYPDYQGDLGFQVWERSDDKKNRK